MVVIDILIRVIIFLVLIPVACLFGIVCFFGVFWAIINIPLKPKSEIKDMKNKLNSAKEALTSVVEESKENVKDGE